MGRTAYFDNAKAILIYLVVLGHLLSSFLGQSHVLDTMYLVMYLFHMPAFILIAGHFSRKVQTKQDVYKLIRTLFVPYVIFQLMYSFYYGTIFRDEIEFHLLEPRYALWFLLSMMMWKLMLSFFGQHPLMIVMAIGLSLQMGYISEVNEWLSLARTFFFFPFFLIGYYVKRENFAKMKKHWNQVVAAVVMLLIVVFMYTFGDIGWREWYYGRIPYEEMQEGLVQQAALSRLVMYSLMLLATYIFLTFVPTRTYWFTNIGGKTLVVYLLHLFIIRAFKETALFEWVGDGHYYALFVMAFLIVYVLSMRWVCQLVAPLYTATKK